MSKNKENRKRNKAALKWIREYSGFWQMICTPDDSDMNITTMRKIIKCLEKNEMYEFIFVLLMVHRDKPYVKSILCTMGLNFAMDEIEQKGMGEIAKMLEKELK